MPGSGQLECRRNFVADLHLLEHEIARLEIAHANQPWSCGAAARSRADSSGSDFITRRMIGSIAPRNKTQARACVF